MGDRGEERSVLYQGRRPPSCILGGLLLDAFHIGNVIK